MVSIDVTERYKYLRIYLFAEKTLALGLREFVDPHLASYHLNMVATLHLTLPTRASFSLASATL